jgi:hypothetical protein
MLDEVITQCVQLVGDGVEEGGALGRAGAAVGRVGGLGGLHGGLDLVAGRLMEGVGQRSPVWASTLFSSTSPLPLSWPAMWFRRCSMDISSPVGNDSRWVGL